MRAPAITAQKQKMYQNGTKLLIANLSTVLLGMKVCHQMTSTSERHVFPAGLNRDGMKAEIVKLRNGQHE